MANRTDPLARAVHGTNPQNLIEKILRMKIYGARYWKEDCFGLSAETLVDKAMDLSHVGGTYGGNRKPTKLICLMLKLLQLQPEKEIIIEFIKNEEYKYVRALGAFYLRLVGKPADIYQYLEPLYNDYRKLRFREIMGWKIVHMDEFIDGLLRDEYCCDLALPHLPKRQLLEDALMLEPRRSALEEDWEGDDDDLDAEDEEEEEELDEDDVRKYVEARYNKMAIGSGDGADGGKDGSEGKKKSRREEERGDRGREKDRDRDRDRKKDPDDARRRRPASRSRSRERARGGRGDARRSRSRDRERGGRRGDRDRDRDRQGRDDRDRGERRRRRRSRSRSGSPRERRRGSERERVRDGDRRRRSSSRDRDRDRRERKKERAKEGRRAERAQEKLFGKKGGGGGKEEEEGGGGGEVGKEGDTEYWNDMRAKLGLKPLK